MIAAVGEDVRLRRYSGTGGSRSPTDFTVKARVTSYQAHDLVGSLQEGDRKLIMLAEDVEESGFETPILSSDKVVVRGRELQVIAPDDSTRRVGGVLIAYELTVRG